MDTSSIGISLFLVMFFTFLNGFFVAAEFAMVKVRPSRLHQLELEGKAQARVARHVTEHLDAYLSACQLGITLASLALGALGEPAISRLLEPAFHSLGVPDALLHTVSFTIAFVIITMLHIVLGELAPKSLAIRKAEATTLITAAPLRVFHTVFYPAIWLMNGAANQLLHLFGIHPVSEHESAHTEEEIRILMKESAKTGHIDQQEMVLFNRMFHFSDRLAREVMVPRVDMVCLDRNAPFAELCAVAEREQHTRYPVCNGSKDEIVGFVHIRDLFTAKDQDIDRLVRPLMAVPENIEISGLLRHMQKERAQLTMIMDEYGGTSGMLTVEDIIEEIVGEIQDEFDNERPRIERQGSHYSLDGNLLIEEVNERFGLVIAAEEDSVGGWLFSRLGPDLRVGATLEAEGVVFRVQALTAHRITRVLLENAVLDQNQG